jgi:hypothetical protein
MVAPLAAAAATAGVAATGAIYHAYKQNKQRAREREEEAKTRQQREALRTVRRWYLNEEQMRERLVGYSTEDLWGQSPTLNPRE